MTKYCHDCGFMPGRKREKFEFLGVLCRGCWGVRKCECAKHSTQGPGGGWIRCKKCNKWMMIVYHVHQTFSSCLDSAFHVIKRGPGKAKGKMCRHPCKALRSYSGSPG